MDVLLVQTRVESRKGEVAEADFATRMRASSSTEAVCGRRMGGEAVVKDGMQVELVEATVL